VSHLISGRGHRRLHSSGQLGANYRTQIQRQRSRSARSDLPHLAKDSEGYGKKCKSEKRGSGQKGLGMSLYRKSDEIANAEVTGDRDTPSSGTLYGTGVWHLLITPLPAAEELMIGK
jgi:hypothetical protein